MLAWGRPEIALREAAVEDCDILAEIHGAAFRRGWSGAEFEALLVQPGVQALLAHYRTAFGARMPAGFLLYRLVGDEAEVLSVAVVHGCRRKGIARVLLEEALRALYRDGARSIHLEVEDGNVAAIGLYRRMEFSQSGHRPGYYAQGRDAPAGALVHAAATPIALGPERPVTQAISPNPGPAVAGSLEAACAEKGMRMTEQRRTIARVLEASDDHPDVEELYRRASAADPNISISTVYRTMKLFEDAGIIERHDFRDGRSRYEPLPEEHHDHLIDIRSGAVVEFRDEAIEKIQERIARDLGYRIIGHRLELYAVPLDDRAPPDPTD